MNTNLQGKAALITGGSKGIGKAIAFALAGEGVRIAICARDELALHQTAHELEGALHADVVAVKANVTKLNDIRRVVDAAARKFDRIDILVNNAGGAAAGGIYKTTDEEWEHHIQLKLLGTIRMAREVVPLMKKQGGGKIINVAGMAAREPHPMSMVAGVMNAAILNFTRSLSRELERDRITVNAINPGATDTPLTEETFKAMGAALQTTPEEIRRSVAAAFPSGSLLKAEDIAKAVVFLASDAADAITGISIDVDAGKYPSVW